DLIPNRLPLLFADSWNGKQFFHAFEPVSLFAKFQDSLGQRRPDAWKRFQFFQGRRIEIDDQQQNRCDFHDGLKLRFTNSTASAAVVNRPSSCSSSTRVRISLN